MTTISATNGQDVRNAKFALSAVAGALFGAWLLIAICVPGVLRAVNLTDAQVWPATEATIVASGADDLCSRSGAHSLRLQYAYEVAGHHFDGSRFELFEANCYPDSRIDELVKRFPAGAPVQIRFNPKSPGQSAVSVDGDLALARSQALAGTVFFVVYSALAVACFLFVRVRTRLAAS